MSGKFHRKIFTIIEIIQTEARFWYLKKDFACCVGDYLLLRKTR